MTTRRHELQRIIRLYKQETGENQVEMRKVAEYATKRLHMQLPKPQDPLEILASRFSQAAREEIRHDKNTGRPYRANHAIPAGQGYLWIDIDEAPRSAIQRSLILRRGQIVDDALQLSFDTDHWNAMHPSEEPIVVPLDFTEDVEERKHASDEEAA